MNRTFQILFNKGREEGNALLGPWNICVCAKIQEKNSNLDQDPGSNFSLEFKS